MANNIAIKRPPVPGTEGLEISFGTNNEGKASVAVGFYFRIRTDHWSDNKLKYEV